MRYTVIGAGLVFLGIALLIYGGFQGGFFVVFPFIVSSSPAGAMGILFIMGGSILLFFGMAAGNMSYEPYIRGENTSGAEPSIERKNRGAAVVLVGPVPLVIDTDNRKLTFISIAVFLIAIVALLLILF